MRLVFVWAYLWRATHKNGDAFRPVEKVAHQTGVVVTPEGADGFVYQIDAAAVTGNDDTTIRLSLLRVIEPIAGEVEIAGYSAVRDSNGRLTGYRVHVVR